MNILKKEKRKKKEPRPIGTMVILLSKNSGRILAQICQCPSASTKRSNNAWMFHLFCGFQMETAIGLRKWFSMQPLFLS